MPCHENLWILTRRIPTLDSTLKLKEIHENCSRVMGKKWESEGARSGEDEGCNGIFKLNVLLAAFIIKARTIDWLVD